MELLVTCVSKNRSFGKALTRNREPIARLEAVAESLPTENEPFDVLQVIFMDRAEDYVHPVVPQDDRIRQIEVGMGLDVTFPPSADSEFIRLLVRQVASAIRDSTLSSQGKVILLQRLEEMPSC